MTKYKALKDSIIECKCGEGIIIPKGCSIICGCGEHHEPKVQEFEPIPEKKEWASNGMYIGEGEPKYNPATNANINQVCINYHFCLKDNEAATLLRDKLDALKAIWKWKENNDGGFVPDLDDKDLTKWHPSYDNEEKKLVACAKTFMYSIPFLPYYSNEGVADRAIEALEQEYKTILTK